MDPDVAVVIVSYNSIHVIEGLLDSLPDALGALTADVVVVDNGSTDGTRELLSRRQDCRLVCSENVGYAGGINLGVRNARHSERILVLNPDLRLHRHAVVAMTAALGQRRTGIVAPQVRTPGGDLHRSLRREPSLLRATGLAGTRLSAFSEYLGRPEAYESPRVVDWALGAVLLISRACYDSVGGWDESYFLYSEETEFCLRARDLGFLTRYEPTALATHIGAQSGQSDSTHAMQIVNRVRLYRRRHSRAASWTYYGLTVASELSWAARGARRSRYAVTALLEPSRRPPQLGCSTDRLPS